MTIAPQSSISQSFTGIAVTITDGNNSACRRLFFINSDIAEMRGVQSASRIHLVSAQTEAGQQKSVRQYLAPRRVRRIIKVLHYYDDPIVTIRRTIIFRFVFFLPEMLWLVVRRKRTSHTPCTAGKCLTSTHRAKLANV